MSQKHCCQKDSKLLEVLQHFYPNNSSTSLRSWIEQGRVTVDEVVAKKPQLLIKAGQSILIHKRENLVEHRFPILFSDEAVVVIEKPQGLLSVSTFFEKNETAFACLKRKYYPKQVYVVHRLDQETSGVMLFALSEKALEALKKDFAKHAIERKYVAIVEGKLERKKGSWKSYLYEDANYVVRETSHSDKGELAITHYRVLSETSLYSLLELTLETGKKNQIRVHCQQAGHSVVGDLKYGAKSNPIKRLCLHAQHLAFTHPLTGKQMRFTSPVPSTFLKLIK